MFQNTRTNMIEIKGGVKNLQLYPDISTLLSATDEQVDKIKMLS